LDQLTQTPALRPQRPTGIRSKRLLNRKARLNPADR
jgi:hypothetical protein